MNEHLNIEINDKLNFKKVTCKEGHYITNWNKEDILEYTSAVIMYCPLNTNLDSFYCLTEEEHNALMVEKELKIKEREEELRNNK